MKRMLMGIRFLLESTAGLFLLLVTPFVAVDLFHGSLSLAWLLGGFLVACVGFVAGLLLFWDAVRVRMRMKGLR
jgi:hypothetical protein